MKTQILLAFTAAVINETNAAGLRSELAEQAGEIEEPMELA